MNLNVLISCAGKQYPLVKSFIDALEGQGKVIVSDINKFASSMAIADIPIESPRFTDENYSEWCLKVCKNYNVGLWISLIEEELLLLEDLRNSLLELGCMLVGAPKERIKKALDKRYYKSFLAEYGLKVPDTWTLEELKDETIVLEGNYIVKARHGRGSRGIIKSVNSPFLVDIAKSKEYSNQWIAQKMIDGDVYCIDVINDLEGKFVTSLIRKRLIMGNQETDVAETVFCEDIHRIAEKLAIAIKHQGCMDVDIVKNGDDYFVIDLNVRFGGSHIFSLMTGANIPAALIAWRKGKNPNPNWFKHIEGEILTRYSTVAAIKSN